MAGKAPQASPETELWTPAEVAQAMRVTPKTVTRWADSGQLRFVRTMGGHRRYYADQIRAILTGGVLPGTDSAEK